MSKHRCLLWICRNSSEDNYDISYHRLTKSRYTQWMMALGRNPDENLSFENTVCSKHFTDNDFLKKNGKKLLKSNAIPTINLPLFKHKIVDSTDASTSNRNTDTKVILPNETLDDEHLKDSQLSSRDPRMEHNYSASPWKIKYELDREKFAKAELYKKLRNGNRRIERLQNKVVHLKTIVCHLKKNNLYTDIPRTTRASPWKKKKIALVREKCTKKELSKKFRNVNRRIERLEKKVIRLTTVVSHLKKKNLKNEEIKQVLEKNS